MDSDLSDAETAGNRVGFVDSASDGRTSTSPLLLPTAELVLYELVDVTTGGREDTRGERAAGSHCTCLQEQEAASSESSCSVCAAAAPVLASSYAKAMDENVAASSDVMKRSPSGDGKPVSPLVGRRPETKPVLADLCGSNSLPRHFGQQGFPTHTRTLADVSGNQMAGLPGAFAAMSSCENSVMATSANPTASSAPASSALPTSASGSGSGVMSSSAPAAFPLLAGESGGVPGVQSENALLVAAGVVSDDEADSQVRFAVPRSGAASAAAAVGPDDDDDDDDDNAEDDTEDDDVAFALPPSPGEYNAEVAAAGGAQAAGGDGSPFMRAMEAVAVDLDMLQCDGPSPIKRRSTAAAQRATLSPQGSVKSLRQSPRTVQSRPLSQTESLNVYPYVEPRHASNLLTKIERLWNDKNLCDVVLVVNGRRIPAHRIVLCSVSDYFHAMFGGNMAETRMPEVVLHDIDDAAIAQLVGFAYTCKLDIHSQNVQSLLKAASILQMRDVTMACQNYMCDQLHPSNCLGIRMFSQQFGCQELYDSAEKFVEQFFLEVIKQEEFLQLPIDAVEELLLRDDVNVEDECQVYEAVLRWIQYEGGHDRRQYTARLLGCVRLPFLPPEYIVDHIETEEVIVASPECQPLLLEALKYHLLPERCVLSDNRRTRPRRSTVGSLFAVGGMDLSRGAMTIEEYNYRVNEWCTVGEMRSRRLQCGVAVISRFIYTVGGRDGLKTLNSVERFDTRHRTWSTVASMCTHRHGVGVAVLSGPMYAVGGHDGWSYLNTVERYDPDLNCWSFLQPMNAARSTAGVAVLSGKLYAVGGRDSMACLASVECYDPHRNRWIKCAPMSQRRGGVGVAVCNGKLFAVGGHEQATPFDLVECYDPAVDQWSKISPMMSCRDAVGVTSFANKLFAVGGYNGYMYLNSVECLNIATKKWESKSVLCTGRAGAGVVAVHDPSFSDDDDLGSAL